MKKYNKITQPILNKLINIVAEKNLLIDQDSLTLYGHDETENLQFSPEVVLKPSNTEQVSKIMKLAFENNIAVTPIGARTGLSGGSLCVHGGIGLSMEKFNEILKIDLDNLQVIVQPGVITQHLQDEVAKKGLYYAPDPASKGS